MRIGTILLAGASTIAVCQAAFAESSTKFFDIKAQPAASSITRFAHEADVQILAPASMVRGKATNALHGEMTVQSAIQQLVAGTGLQIVSDDGRTITLAPQQEAVLAAADSAPVAPSQVGTPKRAQAVVSSPSEIETVTVTARRREENLQRVPITISALSAEGLANRQVVTQTDLQFSTPGLIVHQSQSRNLQNFAIRGQSIDAYTNSQPSVLPYIDDYQNSTVTASSLYDLSSVQVLKGPQGTLFGRNTTGGAVLYITEKPNTEAFTGYGLVRIGNYDWHEFQGALNIPVSDDFAVRVAGDINKRDGYITNMVSGQKLNEDNSTSIRISALWRPSERFENTIVAQYDNGSGAADAIEVWSGYAPGQIGPAPDRYPLNSTSASLFGPDLDLAAGPGAYAALLAAYPGAPAGGYLAAVAQQRAAGPWKVWLDQTPLRHQAHSAYVIDTATYKISDNIQIKNIAGYSQNYNNDDNDSDGTPFAIVNEFIRIRNWQASDELQILGTALDDRLTFIAGVYLSNQRTWQNQGAFVFDVGPVAGPLLGLPVLSANTGVVRDTTEGIFGQVTYKLDDILNGLSFTLGGRYSWEQIRFEERELGGFPPGIIESRSDSNPSWQAGLEYQVNDDLLLYIENRGSWRSGGFNISAPPIPVLANLGGNSFEPETTHDVEIGAKFQGHLGDIPVRLNVDVFNQWVQDVQRVAFLFLPGVGATALTVNVPGGAQFRGVEVDGEIFPVEWLGLGAAFSVTDASYGDPHRLTLFGTLVDYDTFADIAKYSGNVYAQVYFPIDPSLGSAMTLRADFYASSPVNFSNFGFSNVPETKLPGYGLMNFRFSWEGIAQTQFSFAAFVKNAFNQPYYTGGIGTASQTGSNAVTPGQPRFYGVEVGYKF